MKKKQIVEFIIVLLASLIIVFGTTIWFGTIDSGWHFVDDHEFLEYANMMKYDNMSLSQVIDKVMAVDRRARNNSLYYPSRIILGYLVGPNYFYLSVVKAIETVIAMILLYYLGKKLSGSIGLGVFFTLTCLVGYQSAVWWKLGPPHVQSTIFFAIAYLCYLKWHDNNAKIGFGILSFIAAVVMGYYHESFFFLIPYFIVYPFFLEYMNSGIRDEKKNLWEKIKITVVSVVNKHKPEFIYSLGLVLAFGFILLTIIFRLGLNSYKAVGVDDSTSIMSYARTILANFDYDLKWYWHTGIILVGILLTFFDQFKKCIPQMLMALLFMGPQFVLYGKEGIAERYLLPVVIGFALFFVIFMPLESFLKGGRKKLYIAVVVVMLLLNARTMIIEADYYRFRGQSIEKVLTQFEELESKGYKVMSCFGNANPEADMTIEAYLLYNGQPNCYYGVNSTQKVLCERPFFNANAATIDFSEIDVVADYNTNDRHFVAETTFDLSDFEAIKAGSITIYYRNGAKNEITDELREKLYVKPTIFGIGA